MAANCWMHKRSGIDRALARLAEISRMDDPKAIKSEIEALEKHCVSLVCRAAHGEEASAKLCLATESTVRIAVQTMEIGRRAVKRNRTLNNTTRQQL